MLLHAALNFMHVSMGIQTHLDPDSVVGLTIGYLTGHRNKHVYDNVKATRLECLHVFLPGLAYQRVRYFKTVATMM